MGSLRNEIYTKLRSSDLASQIRAIRQLANLEPLEAVQIIETIIQQRSLALRIEALSILPDIVNAETEEPAGRTLLTALRASDPEIVRNALLAIRRMPRTFPAQALTNSILQLLSAEDSDLQYHAILCLSHLRRQFPTEMLVAHLTPLVSHINEVVRETAADVLRAVRQGS